MIDFPIKARFEEFSLPGIKPENSSLVIPTVKETFASKFGTHGYYFLNLKTANGLCVTIKHSSIIFPGLWRFRQASYKRYWFAPLTGFLTLRYHYGFNFLEQIMLMTVPHTVTDLGRGKFIINLWSYFGCLVVDCREKSVIYRMLEPSDGNFVLGSRQWYDHEIDTLIYMSYSLKDSFKKALDPTAQVFSKILKLDNKSGETSEIWSGYFSDYMHDILISKNGHYLVACELGRFSDKNNDPIPSKVLVLDLRTGKYWIISSIGNAAHAQFDPVEPNIIYFSNHNFQFVHTPLVHLFKKGSYTLKFLGPASVHKFVLTSDGPQPLGVYSEPDLFRLTNHHVFDCHGRKLLAAMGAPNFIFIVDSQNLTLIKKIEVQNHDPSIPAYIGTFSVAKAGDKLYVQTTRSFQIIDIESGKPDYMRGSDFNHICSNHMMTSSSVDW